jgi:hypothetical protein
MMNKAEKRTFSLKLRFDENSRLIARQKRDFRRWGGFIVGDKENYAITNISRGILVGGRRRSE